jgi:hypothetical protein
MLRRNQTIYTREGRHAVPVHWFAPPKRGRNAARGDALRTPPLDLSNLAEHVN